MRVAEKATNLKVLTTMREMVQVSVVCVHALVAPYIVTQGMKAINPVKAPASHVRATIATIAPDKALPGEAMALATTPTQQE